MPVEQCSYIVTSVVLQMLVLSALIGGAYRKYPFVFAQSIVGFLITVVHTAAYSDLWKWTPQTAKYYWTTEAIYMVVQLATLISLVDQAAAGSENRRLLRWLLIALAAAGALITLLIHNGRPYSTWMTLWNRDLNVVLLMFNLILWRFLIRCPPAQQLLLVCAAYGFSIAGQASGHALRMLSSDLVWLGNRVLVFGHLISVFVLWRALRVRHAAVVVLPGPQPVQPVWRLPAP